MMTVVVVVFFVVFFSLAIYLNRVFERREENKMKNKNQFR